MQMDDFILEHYISNHSDDVARFLEQYTLDEVASFLEGIQERLAVKIFKQLESLTSIKCLEKFSTEKAANILKELPLIVTSVFLRKMKKELREKVIQLIPKEKSIQISRLLRYPEDSAGGLADPQLLTILEDLTIKEALQRLTKFPESAIYYLYVVNRNHELKGVINLRELMLSEPTDNISVKMQKNIVRLSAGLNFKAVINHPGWQKFHALPVVSGSGILIGVIHYKILKQLEITSRKTRLPRQAIAAGNALGELFQIGLSGLISSATKPLKNN
jgi:magnesium transporter